MSVVQFPAVTAPWNRPVWQDMVSRSESYAPIALRLIGFWICIGKRNDERDDSDVSEKLALENVPGYAALLDDEQEFVRAGALAMLFQMNVEDDLRDHFDNWIREGAYV